MSWANYQDVLDQIQAAGLDVAHLDIGTPRPVRCRERDGDREKRGWYWLSDIELDARKPDGSTHRESYIVGSYGIYRGNDSGKQNVRLDKRVQVSDEQRKAIAQRQADNAKRVKAMRKAEAERAGAKAANAWRQYVPDGVSDYLIRKGVDAYGVRFAPSGNGTLAVPMSDSGGRIWGLQIIRGKDRRTGQLEKEYWPVGLLKQGHYHLIGSPRDVLLIVEGYATAATLHAATGLPVAVAFDANNLLPVAIELRKAYRNIRILICADDDYLQRCKSCDKLTEVADQACSHCGEPHGKTNAGINAAHAAAHAVDGKVVAPQFPATRGGKKLTDFNDLAAFPDGGLHLVARQIDAAIAEAGWQTPKTSVSAEANNGGAGDRQRRNAVSILPLDDAVERFMPLDDGTGKYLFDSWTNRIVLREQMLVLLPAGVRGDDVKRHPVWSNRGAYYLDQVGFDPTGRDESVVLNTWKGWPIKPAPGGSCQLILDLLLYLCNSEGRGDEIAQWVLRWMAYPLQNPGAKMSSAIIMHGPQGTGKSAVFQTLARIYGDYSTVLNQRGLEDKFNSDWADSKLFILAEEVVTRAEMWHIKNELKELVTGEWIRVNPKNIAAYRQRNQVNIAYLSNEGQPLPIENDDRRHLVVWTPPMLADDFYDDVWREIDSGGAEAFYHHLLNLDLGDFHPKKRPPMTEAKQDLINLSLPSEDRFINEWAEGETQWPFMPCASEHIYRAYFRWCRDNGVRNPRESNQFLGRIKRLPGWMGARQRIYASRSSISELIQKSMVLPDASLLEKRGVRQPEHKTRAAWLTECFFDFKEALEAA